MEKLEDLYPTKSQDPKAHLSQALQKRFRRPDLYDEAETLTLQLGSNNPDRLYQCVKYTLENGYRFREININCGCPSIESGGADTYGAKLMTDAALTGRLVESIQKAIQDVDIKDDNHNNKAPLDVSVKCRIGIFEHLDDLRPLNVLDDKKDYLFLKNYVQTIQDAGANHVILHSRPAILSGLSPVKNRKSGIVPLNYDFPKRIASDFPDLKITLNGGIKNFSQMISLQDETNIHSQMAGRWVLQRPLDLIGIEQLLLNGGDEESIISSSSSSVVCHENLANDAIKEYTNFVFDMVSNKEKFNMAELSLPLFLIAEQLREDYDEYFEYNDEYDDDETDDREEGSSQKAVLSSESIESLYDTLQSSVDQLESLKGSKKKKKKKKGEELHIIRSDSDVNFKQLSKSFKGIVGTKVMNKWKRNRSEL